MAAVQTGALAPGPDHQQQQKQDSTGILITLYKTCIHSSYRTFRLTAGSAAPTAIPLCHESGVHVVCSNVLHLRSPDRI
jgi:hypothetical protein